MMENVKAERRRERARNKLKMGNPFKTLKEIVTKGDWHVTLSALIMGAGQLFYRQFAKGVMYLLLQAAIIVYFVLYGAGAVAGFFTLGTVESNPQLQIVGDDSVIMMLMGILSFFILGIYFALLYANLKGVYVSQQRVAAGKKPTSFKEDLRALLDKKFYVTALVLPVIGVFVFSVLPILFMILIAFTNYGGKIIPPKLVDWTGFSNFKQILFIGEYAPTFFKILLWNFIWAILSTSFNYFAALALALLYNKKCVRGRVLWRAFPIVAMAVPGFISLLAFKFMFSYGGPINQMIVEAGGKAIGFLDIDAKWSARLIGLMVNAWITIPSGMLLATGILSNMNTDLYEAATIDGASPFRQFLALTLPFVVFATTPVLISQFIGNFNNFGIFYFLRSDITTEGYNLANNTDLLINWLYKLSVDNQRYNVGAAISIIIFAITSVISLIVYTLSPSYKQEDTFR